MDTKHKTVDYWVPRKEGMECPHLMSIQLLLEVIKSFRNSGNSCINIVNLSTVTSYML